MYEDDNDENEIFDFDEIANHLIEQGLQSSPADIHGCLCGLLAAGAAVEPELALAALVEAEDLELRGELAEQVMRLYTVSAAALEDEAFEFHPLLPDDETDLDRPAVIVSSDSHVGPRLEEDLRQYCPAAWLDEFDNDLSKQTYLAEKAERNNLNTENHK